MDKRIESKNQEKKMKNMHGILKRIYCFHLHTHIDANKKVDDNKTKKKNDFGKQGGFFLLYTRVKLLLHTRQTQAVIQPKEKTTKINQVKTTIEACLFGTF